MHSCVAKGSVTYSYGEKVSTKSLVRELVIELTGIKSDPVPAKSESVESGPHHNPITLDFVAFAASQISTISL